jgi:hypothetical protein
MPGGGNNSTYGLKDRTKNGFVQLSLRNASGEAIRQSNSSKSALRFLRPELRGNKEIEHFRASKKNGKALAMHEAQNVVYESRMGVGEVAFSAVTRDAGQLERMLIIENMIDLLGVRRPTGGNGNVDGMEIAEIDIDHAAG